MWIKSNVAMAHPTAAELRGIIIKINNLIFLMRGNKVLSPLSLRKRFVYNIKEVNYIHATN